jgi:hypothetical protein
MCSDLHGRDAAPDRKRFLALICSSLVLVLLVLASNSFLDAYLAGLQERARRQSHYEKVIQKKGLGLHKGMYWKEKE